MSTQSAGLVAALRRRLDSCIEILAVCLEASGDEAWSAGSTRWVGFQE